MIGITKPPDLDGVRRHVDAFMLAEGAGHWPDKQVALLTRLVGGKPAFSACIDWVGHRLGDDHPRTDFALATALAIVVPPPVSEHAAGLQAPVAAAHARYRDAGAYAQRGDRLALDLAVAGALRGVPWPTAWEVPKRLLAADIEAALRRLTQTGVAPEFGFVPASPSFPHRARHLAGAFAEGTCTCAGPAAVPACGQPAGHSLVAWDPATSALATFVERAVRGPADDGRGGLSLADVPAGGRRRRR